MRQPGSSWKLFVYLAAIEAGHKPDEPIVDEPVTIDGWSPRNDERTFAGQINIRTAFAFSLNTVAAKLGQMVGFDTVADMARRFGISTPINTHPSMVLGTSDVRLIDMTRAFAEVDNGGAAVIALCDHQGGRPRRQRALPACGARAARAGRTVGRRRDDRPAADRGQHRHRPRRADRPAGRGQDRHDLVEQDGWFLGFSSGLTTGVWMGRDDAKPNPGLHGGRAPARAFADYMKVAVAKPPGRRSSIPR